MTLEFHIHFSSMLLPTSLLLPSSHPCLVTCLKSDVGFHSNPLYPYQKGVSLQIRKDAEQGESQKQHKHAFVKLLISNQHVLHTDCLFLMSSEKAVN